VVDETRRGAHVELHGDEGELNTWTSPSGRRRSMASGGALTNILARCGAPRVGGGQTTPAGL
jgi:hypothetical protein